MNETLQTIAKRYSCRGYDGRLPEREKIEAIALAAVQSPSAMNVQPWKVIVVLNKAIIEEMDAECLNKLSKLEDTSAYERMMSRGGKVYYNAPCMFVIAKQKGTDLDTGIVSENIALAATSLGLGNVICGIAGIPFTGARGDEFKTKIGIPEGYEFGVSVLVGYTKEQGKPHISDTSKIYYVE